jgi:hypothetical protein
MSSLVSPEGNQAPRTRKRAFQYPALPLSPNFDKLTDANCLVDDIHRHGEAVENWGRGTQAYAILLNEILNNGIGLNFFTTANGYSAEFELPETPESQALVDSAVRRANEIIGSTYHMTGFTLQAPTTSANTGINYPPIAQSQYHRRPALQYVIPHKPGATSPVAAKQQAGIETPTPAPKARGRPKGSGNRGVSFILMQLVLKRHPQYLLTRMYVSQGETATKVTKPKKTPATPRKATTTPRKRALKKNIIAAVVATEEAAGGVELGGGDAGEASGAGRSIGMGLDMCMDMGAETAGEMVLDASADEHKCQAEEQGDNGMHAFETAWVAEFANAVEGALDSCIPSIK